MAHLVEGVNPKILRECREQISLDVATAAKKAGTKEHIIEMLENGQKKPTFRQLDRLAEAYQVMSWVFIADNLPEQYRLDAVPAFRQFAKENADVFSTHEIKKLSAKVVNLRECIFDLLEDTDEPMPHFNSPKIDGGMSIENIAKRTREWLGVKDNTHHYISEWKEMIETKGVFVFMTSKYLGWSHVDPELFRGLTIYYPTLPIIIINNSDAMRAQSFTLFHELGHVLRKESSLDRWVHGRQEEQWCDKLASNILMPTQEFLHQVDKKGRVDTLELIKPVADIFKVSSYACLVRLRQLNKINQSIYEKLERQIKKEYDDIRKTQKELKIPISRKRPKEILNQYGRIYLRTVFQAYHNKEINLHRLLHFTDLKQVPQVFELEKKL